MLKKKYVINIDNNRHTAIVASDGIHTHVQVGNGDLTAVNYRPVLGGKAISIRWEGRLQLVHLTGIDRHGTVQATINGRPITLTVGDELRQQAQDDLGLGATDGTLKADIPGLVVSLAVKKGQAVTCGDPVLILEAMKMQNELVAPVTGQIVTIMVSAGDTVNPGDLLLSIEPDATADSPD